MGVGGGGGRGYDDAVTFALLVEDVGVWSLVVNEVDTTQVLHHNVQLVMRLKQTATGQPLSQRPVDYVSETQQQVSPCHNVLLSMCLKHSNRSAPVTTSC